MTTVTSKWYLVFGLKQKYSKSVMTNIKLMVSVRGYSLVNITYFLLLTKYFQKHGKIKTLKIVIFTTSVHFYVLEMTEWRSREGERNTREMKKLSCDLCFFFTVHWNKNVKIPFNKISRYYAHVALNCGSFTVLLLLIISSNRQQWGSFSMCKQPSTYYHTFFATLHSNSKCF